MRHETAAHDQVTFELHETFANPRRTIEQQPFEVTEFGWGQFDIGITLHFTPDARESDVTLFHMLRLYEDDGSHSLKKVSAVFNTVRRALSPTRSSSECFLLQPVVHETYEDVVFSEPHEDFYNRVSKHVPGESNHRLMSVS